MRRALTLALWLLVAGAAVREIRIVRLAAGHVSGEFLAYYGAARATLAGRPVASFYDDDVFFGYTKETGVPARNIYYPNPPTTVLFALPLGLLSLQAARTLLLAATLAAAATSAIVLIRVFRLEGAAPPLFLSFLLLCQPFTADLLHGQVYGIVTAVQVLGLLAVHRGRDSLAGLPFGVALSAKLAGPYLVFLAFARRFRPAVLLMGATFALLGALSAAALGAAAWTGFAGIFPRVASDRTLVDPSFQSLHGLVFRVLTRDPVWNPAGPVHAPLLASALYGGLVLALAGLGLRTLRGAPPVRAVVYFLTLSVVASPFAQDYTYLGTLPAAALACREIASRPVGRAALGWLLGLALTGLPIARHVDLPRGGWLSPLAYPAVLGAVVLLVLVARSDRSSQPERTKG